jgi:hypothetical protein
MLPLAVVSNGVVISNRLNAANSTADLNSLSDWANRKKLRKRTSNNNFCRIEQICLLIL